MSKPKPKLRKLKVKDDTYFGVGMLVESTALNCEYIVIASRHEDMQRAAEKLGIKYDTRKAKQLKIQPI